MEVLNTTDDIYKGPTMSNSPSSSSNTMANFMENTTAVLALSLIIVTLQGPVISFGIPRNAKALYVYCLDLEFNSQYTNLRFRSIQTIVLQLIHVSEAVPSKTLLWSRVLTNASVYV